MEHGGGWEFGDPTDKIHFYTKKPMLDSWTLRDAGLYMMKNKSKFNLSKENWGLREPLLFENY